MSNFNYRNSKKFKYGYYDSSSYQPNQQEGASGSSSGGNNGTNPSLNPNQNHQNSNQNHQHSTHNQSQNNSYSNSRQGNHSSYPYNSYSSYNHNFKPKYKRKNWYDNRSSHYTPNYGSHGPDERRDNRDVRDNNSYRRNSYDEYKPKPAFELKSLKSRSISPNKSRDDRFRDDGRDDRRSRKNSIAQETVKEENDEGGVVDEEIKEKESKVLESRNEKETKGKGSNSDSRVIEITDKVLKEDHQSSKAVGMESKELTEHKEPVKDKEPTDTISESKSAEQPSKTASPEGTKESESKQETGSIEHEKEEKEELNHEEEKVNHEQQKEVELSVESPISNIPSVPSSAVSSVPTIPSSAVSLSSTSNGPKSPELGELSRIDESEDEIEESAKGEESENDVEENEDDSESEDEVEEKGENKDIDESEEEYDDMEIDSEAETIVSDSMPSARNATKLIKEFDTSDKQLRPYVLKRDASGSSLLQRACKKGNLEEVKNLIERGASANESDFCGFTCLHEAALKGDEDIVTYLIEHGADVNKQALPDGDLETPLIDAADNKHLEIVKILLDHGADPRIYNSDGFTALTKIHDQHQDEEGYEEIIKLLEDANAKYVDKVDYNKDYRSPSPNTVIEDPNDNYFGELLRKKNHTAQIYKFAAEGVKDLTAQYVVEGGRLDLKPDILILAARNGHLELVDIMLGLVGEYDINVVNNCGLSALLASVGRGHINVIKFLLERGANPFLRRKQDGLNALEISQRSPNYDPEEVDLIEGHMKKNPNYSILSQSQRPAQTQTPQLPSVEKKRKTSDIEEKKIKKVKIEKTERNEQSKSNEIHKTKSRDEIQRTKSRDELHKVKSNELHKTKSRDHNHKHELTKIKTKEETPQKESTPSSPNIVRAKSPSPPPAPTAEELELKAKKEQEVKMYQEKAEAKRKARRDMFLKSEKEKERRRLEEEQKAKEEKKQKEILKQKEDENKLKEIEMETKRVETEKHNKRLLLKWNQLPIGLQYLKIKDINQDDILKYCPIFKFNIKGEEYVIDLHVTLITGIGMPAVSAGLISSDQFEATDEDKTKLWSLFSGLIGAKDPSQPLNLDLLVKGHDQFKSIIIKFVKFQKVVDFLKEKAPLTYDTVIEKEQFIVVDFDHLNGFKPPQPKVEEQPATLAFVPFAYRNRPDLIKGAQEQTNLW